MSKSTAVKIRSLGQVSIFAVTLLLSCGLGTGLAKDTTLSKVNDHYLKNYNFSADYFTSNIPLWTKILGHLKAKPNIHYLEIGVCEGGAAIWMVENILTAPTSKMTCIDIFPGEELQERFLANLRISGFLEKTTVIKGRSQIELRKLPINSFDIVYIDGSCASDDVLTDAVLSWGLLKTGGIMIIDNRGNEQQPVELRPQIAIDSFINSFKDYVEILHYGFQVILRKRSIITYRNEKFSFSVDIPSDWRKVNEENVLGREHIRVTFVNLTIPSGIYVEANSILFGMEDAKREATNRFKNKSEALFKKTGYRTEIISEESSIINGLEGYRIVYKGPLETRLFKAEGFYTEVYFVKETTVYMLRFCVMKKGDLEKYQKEIFEDIILNSFKLDDSANLK